MFGAAVDGGVVVVVAEVNRLRWVYLPATAPALDAALSYSSLHLCSEYLMHPTVVRHGSDSANDVDSRVRLEVIVSALADAEASVAAVEGMGGYSDSSSDDQRGCDVCGCALDLGVGHGCTP